MKCLQYLSIFLKYLHYVNIGINENFRIETLTILLTLFNVFIKITRENICFRLMNLK